METYKFDGGKKKGHKSNDEKIGGDKEPIW